MASIQSITPVQIVPTSIVDLWSDTEKLLDRIRDRAYQLFELRGRDDGNDLQDWFNAEKESMIPMSIEVTGEDGKVSVRLAAPGFDAEEIKISLLPGTLTVRGEHREKNFEKKQSNKTERNYSFYSEVELPAEIIPELATATLKNGVLELTAPKAKAALAVQVKAA